MSRVLWVDPSFGASGDMFLGGLADLVGSTDELVQGLATLGIDGYSIHSETVTRNGIAANRVYVETTPTHTARRWLEIDELIAEADLPDFVRAGSRRTFRRLGEVEAQQHQVDINDVHFHEVGAIDAIVDIVGTWILLDRLDVRNVVVGPVGIGHGTVKAAHGLLPLPAPATSGLLVGMPVRSLDTNMETCTPTGAALLRELSTSSGSLPGGTILQLARGAGSRNPGSHPNVLSIYFMELDAEPLGSAHCEAGLLLATNLDDVTPEVLAHTLQVLLEEGASDAWVVPVLMKKGRSAHELRVLCTQENSRKLRALMFRETGTLGIREATIVKHVQAREFENVMVRGHTVSMKIGPHGAKPEHGDLVRAARVTGVTVRALALEAQLAFVNGSTRETPA
jgi:pyridinium-3,5-bisthiocarboxylic acid mononucleotide nickel chelatase